MIKIGNHEWRTLRQPIIAQSKVVKEVWINDQDMVYPEGTFAKMRVRFKESFFHYHFGVIDPELGGDGKGGYWPAYTRIYWSVVIAGAIILRRRAIDNANIGITKSTTAYPSEHGIMSDEGHEFNMYSTYAKSLIHPKTGQYGFTTKAWGLEWGNYDIIDAKAKFIVDPFPVCGPYRQPFHGDGYYYTPFYTSETGRELSDMESYTPHYSDYQSGLYPRYYNTYEITPSYSTIEGPAEFNEKIFALNPDTSKDEYELGVNVHNAYVASPTGYTNIKFDQRGLKFYAVYPYEIKLDEIKGRVKYDEEEKEEEESEEEEGKEEEEEEETITELGYYYKDGGIDIQFPYSEIVYLGPENEASEEDLVISDEDLDLSLVPD